MDEYLNQALRLTTNYISRRSVAIVVRDSAGNTAIGSSTCIKIGPYSLLATAGHVIADVFDERIELIPAGEFAARPVPFVARSCSPTTPAPPTDVAWIQLDPDQTRDLQFLDLQDLYPAQPLNRDRPFIVNGYPYESAIISPGTIDVESTVASTMMAEPRDLPWELKPTELALEYPPRDAGGRPMQGVPHPKGVSGGGSWRQPRYDEHAIFSPERFMLVGINTLWDKGSSILFATRIEHWLNLVAENLPECRSEIAGILGSSM